MEGWVEKTLIKMISDYFGIAFKNLKKRRLRSWLTMIGIFIGIAAVVALISLGSALEGAIFGQFGDLSPEYLTVTSVETGFGPPGSTAVRKLTDDDVEIIESIQGVKTVVPRYLRNTAATYRGTLGFLTTVSMPHEQERLDMVYDVTGIEIEVGRELRRDDSGVIIIGSTIAYDNNFGRDISVGDTISIQGENFRVVGIMKETGTFTINQATLMMEDDLERILDIDGQYDLIGVKVEDFNEAEIVAERIADALRDDRDQDPGEEDFSVQTPADTLSTIGSILDAVNLVVISIAAISLFVGGVGITNTMYTSVLERTKEIGVMKAVGAKNRNVLTLFLMESALLGLVGGLIGIAVGLGLAFGAAFLVEIIFPALTFTVDLSYPLILGALAFSVLVGTISGMLPAVQASRMRPVEAFRK